MSGGTNIMSGGTHIMSGRTNIIIGGTNIVRGKEKPTPADFLFSPMGIGKYWISPTNFLELLNSD